MLLVTAVDEAEVASDFVVLGGSVAAGVSELGELAAGFFAPLELLRKSVAYQPDPLS